MPGTRQKRMRKKKPTVESTEVPGSDRVPNSLVLLSLVTEFFLLQEEGWEPDFHTCDALPLAGVGRRGKGCDDIRRYT